MRDNKNLRGLDDIIWFFFGNRVYARNSQDNSYFATYLFCLLLAAGSIAVFEYLPFKFLGMLLFIGVNLTVIAFPIKHANVSSVLIWINAILGAMGLVTHWHFGLTIFHFHLEQYLFWIYLSSGLLAAYRRFWNHIIWKKLDAITERHLISSTAS